MDGYTKTFRTCVILVVLIYYSSFCSYFDLDLILSKLVVFDVFISFFLDIFYLFLVTIIILILFFSQNQYHDCSKEDEQNMHYCKINIFRKSYSYLSALTFLNVKIKQ